MERSHIEIAGSLLAHQLSDTVSHLLGRLVGKRQRQDIPWHHPLIQQVCNLVGQHTRLT